MKILAMLIVAMFSSQVANAQLAVQASAKKIQFSLVNYVPICSGPDTTDPVTGTSACTYGGPGVGECKLAPNGKGSFTLARKTNKLTGVDDILITYKLSGLDAACEGKELYPLITSMQAHDGCANGQSCVNRIVTIDLAESHFRCAVANGKCGAKAFATATEAFEWLASGRNTTFVSLGCQIREFPGFIDRFSCSIAF